MQIPDYIDIERVHRVLEGIDIGRGAGQTTAIFVTIATALMIEQNQSFLVISKNHHLSEHNKHLCFDLLIDCGYTEAKIVADRIILGGGSYIKFVPADMVERYMRGLTITNYYIDNSIVDQRDLDMINRAMSYRTY